MKYIRSLRLSHFNHIAWIFYQRIIHRILCLSFSLSLVNLIRSIPIFTNEMSFSYNIFSSKLPFYSLLSFFWYVRAMTMNKNSLGVAYINSFEFQYGDWRRKKCRSDENQTHTHTRFLKIESNNKKKLSLECERVRERSLSTRHAMVSSNKTSERANERAKERINNVNERISFVCSSSSSISFEYMHIFFSVFYTLFFFPLFFRRHHHLRKY